MSKLAIGMFDNAQAARAVIQDLEREGFRPSEVDLVARRDDFESGPPLGPLEQAQSESGLGAGAAVAHTTWHASLIRSLTAMGMAGDEAEDYAEGVRRGAALVLVKTSDNRADTAAAIMDRDHACRVQERVAQWTQEGWQRQFARAGQDRDLHIRVDDEGTQAGRVRYGSGGARVFVW